MASKVSAKMKISAWRIRRRKYRNIENIISGWLVKKSW
jgi:hypothetical protein